MKQIKTVYKDINPRLSPTQEAQEFDDEVNAALNEGWTLVKRGVLDPHVGEIYDYQRTFYAELEKEIVSRGCINCRHFDDTSDTRPCINCDGNYSKWEPEA